ncbi:MAG TPA: hypothetical protein VM434_05155 [Beijerinckiaceae bacterium]|nr:hypothetical protein [Beijerinckiaceae bacterium]
MRKTLAAVATAGILGAGAFALQPAPAAAQGFGPHGWGGPGPHYVQRTERMRPQHRRVQPGPVAPRYGHRYHGPRYGYRHPGYRYDPGAAAAAGIAGLATGAIIAGAMAQQQNPANLRCIQGQLAFDPASGTYVCVLR